MRSSGRTMRVTLTGASGLIGTKLVGALKARGDEVTVLSRDPARASRTLGVAAEAWEPTAGPPPAVALVGRDAIVHLAGERVDQRWSESARRAIRVSREAGTRNLVDGLRGAEPRADVLVSSSAVGYYGPHGDEVVDESVPGGGGDFLGEVCAAWEREAERAEELGMRVVRVRTGVVLDRRGGALARMLTPFRAGVGGPIAGGDQYMPWIHADDLVGIYLAAIDGAHWSGPVNASAPAPVTNREFSRALGHALHRPAVLPIPGAALRLLYGEMAEIVTEGQRAVPRRALELGYRFAHPDLEEALRDALA
jgi:uncharacterized protein (TIGR01777 family)